MIPADLLEKLLAETGLPHSVKNVGPSTSGIYEVVADLKAARELGKSPNMHWPELQSILDRAFAHDEWSVLDDLSSAWKEVEPMPESVHIGCGEYAYGLNSIMNDPLRVDIADYKYQEGASGLNHEVLNQKRSPISWIVIGRRGDGHERGGWVGVGFWKTEDGF